MTEPNKTDPGEQRDEKRDADSEFWNAVRPADEPMRRAWFLPSILILLAVSVPWYRSRTGEIRMLHGLPDWVWVTLACSLAISFITAGVALFCWRDDTE